MNGAETGVPERSFKDACMKPIVAEMIDIDPPRRSLPQIAPYRCRHRRQEQRVGGGSAIPVVDDHDVELILQLPQYLEGVIGDTGFGRRERGMEVQQTHRCSARRTNRRMRQMRECQSAPKPVKKLCAQPSFMPPWRSP